MAYGDMSGEEVQPVRGIKALSTEYAAAVIVIGSLFILIAIRRGFFRGVKVPGLG